MSKERMVTRTIDTLWATVLALDTETRESREVIVSLPMLSDTEKMLKEAKKKAHLFNKNEIPVTVIRYEVLTAKYGMTEYEFMIHGKLLS